MSKRNRRNIKHSSARVVLSEVLPFEVPVGFDNIGLYRFLLENKVRRNGKRVNFNSSSPQLHLALRILFGDDLDLQSQPEGGYSISAKCLTRPTVPFQYQIRHRQGLSRSLSIPHPAAQVAVVDFYEEFRSLLLFHTANSPYSIRHPSRVSRYTAFNDSVFAERISPHKLGPESETSEYLNLRSYFVYHKYDNIGKFYESRQYRDNEKRFGHLMRLDITKCFDSVYTHSISWAIYGKESTKHALSQEKSNAKVRTFADAFDVNVRAMNDNETHGILIGPEFSRIFAEVILQRIDRDVESSLRSEGIRRGHDYNILRYVDDYFVFMRDATLQSAIIATLDTALRPYRFHLNKGKEEITNTPFISASSVANGRLWSHLSTELRLHVGMVHDSDIAGFVDFQSSANKMISGYKTVLRETDLDPIDLVGSCLTFIETRLEVELQHFVDADEERQQAEDELDRERCRFHNRKNLIRAFAAIEFSFFVYGGSPRVGTAIKLARIVSLARKAARKVECTVDDAGRLDDLIFGEIEIQLARNPLTSHATVENLYMLTLLRDLGPDYTISESRLCEFVGIGRRGQAFEIPDWYNVMIVCDLLRFTDGVHLYSGILDEIKKWILNRIACLRAASRRHAEETLLVLNVLSAPAIDGETKFQLLRNYGAKSRAEANDFVLTYRRWFTNWELGDLHDELLRKRVQEVY